MRNSINMSGFVLSAERLDFTPTLEDIWISESIAVQNAGALSRTTKSKGGETMKDMWKAAAVTGIGIGFALFCFSPVAIEQGGDFVFIGGVAAFILSMMVITK